MQICTTLLNLVGVYECEEVKSLIKSGQGIVEKFDSTLADFDAYINEYFNKLRNSLKNSYPLFDEMSTDLMDKAINAHIVKLSDLDKQRIKHAGIADNFIQRLRMMTLHLNVCYCMIKI